MRVLRARLKDGKMNSLFVLDACTIVNLARIDEDEFLEDKIKALKAFAVEKAIDELKNRYVPSDKNSKRILHQAPYWGGITRFEDKEVEETVSLVKTFLDYPKKPNGELYSAALSLNLSRMENEKVLFYTDDNPAKSTFSPYFEFQQMGYIGDSVDLLVFLYWLSPAGQFSKEELEKYLSSLRAEYMSKLKDLQKTMDNYASTLTSSKKELNKKFEIEGLSNELKSTHPLKETIKKCYIYFEGDNSVFGKKIKKILVSFKDCPEIAEKVGITLQNIDKYGIFRFEQTNGQ